MDFLFRIATLALGYIYPAYKCFKIIDSSKPKIEQLQIWCQYWIIIAVFTGFERVADTFVSWLPFYSGGKLAFIVYLWHPDTKGTEYVFQTYIKPLVSKHTQEVDLNWVLLRNQASEISTIFWNKLLFYMQLKFSELIHQNAVQPPPAAYPPVLAGLQIYPSMPNSLYRARMPPGQHQQEQLPSYQPSVAPPANLPRGQHQQQPQLSGYQPSLAQAAKLAPGQHLRPPQLPGHQPSPAEPAQRAQHQAASISAASSASIAEDKEDTGFELLHTNEIPASVSSGTPDSNKSGQWFRLRWGSQQSGTQQ